jgi:5'-deoxynucleotidase YfbR-like HD superfamily hydrolase
MPFEVASKVMYDLLEGGGVHRYHMKQTLKDQQVATHSWRMAAILQSLWPDCRKELVMAALFHDVSERVTGDVASPVKWANPALRMELNRVTMAEEERLGIRYQLDAEERNILTWLDRFEGCLYALDEIQMGNRKLHNTFVRYYRASNDAKLRENVYTKRADHMRWLGNHLLSRAAELGIPFPEDR